MFALSLASRLRTWLLAGSTAVMLAAPAVSAPFSNVYVFGDSLVDVGNARIAASAIGAGGSVANPAQGYFAGRFSDGPVFVDYLSQQLTGEFMTPVLAGGTNYAFGGAQAVQGSELVPSLPLQVAGFAALAGRADPDALYVVTVSGNDIRQLVPRMSDPVTGEGAAGSLALAAAVVASQVDRLFDLGAEKVLVTGAPDIGLIPRYSGSPDEAARRGLGTSYAESFDVLLANALGDLMLAEDQELDFFSLLDFSDNLVSSAGMFGLSNLTDSCLAERGPSPDIDCTGFLFFDDVHPTSYVHRLLADRVLGLFAPVPEPGAIGIFSLGLIGLFIRRRRRKSA